MSVKGQIVIPKDVRERLRWEVGAKLDIIEGGGRVVLTPSVAKRKKISAEEYNWLVPRHEGLSVPEEQWRGMVAPDFCRRSKSGEF